MSISINKAPAKKNIVYKTAEEPLPDLTFTIHLKRKGGLQSLAFSAPIFILTILCPCVFLIPHPQSQRFSLGKITVA